jgi:aryl-alcohol dehydrogenase-like predicted oxidoreductase
MEQETINEVVRASLDGGVNWFDTAEAYGGGRSEESLAQALRAANRRNGDVIVATKWWPTLRTARHLRISVNERLRRLGGFGIDLHQIHHPAALTSTRAQMNAMADMVGDGRIRSVGVSNFWASRMRASHFALQDRGLVLASNQVRYSLLDRKIESNGILQSAKELGITLIAYSPLAQGLLSGKFHDRIEDVRQKAGPRKWMPQFGARGLEKSRPVVEALKSIASAHGVTPSQIALAWLLQFHGDTIVVIPGATKVRHAQDNVGAMDVRLTPSELTHLDEISRRFM